MDVKSGIDIEKARAHAIEKAIRMKMLMVWAKLPDGPERQEIITKIRLWDVVHHIEEERRGGLG